AALGFAGERLVWSCETGQGAGGDRFIEGLCWATGALVAAATGIVGAATRGGRWELNARLGATLVSMPLTAAGMAAYAGVLAPETLTWTGPGGTTTNPTSGNWGTSTNWSGTTVRVPANGDTVVIAGTGSYTVTLAASPGKTLAGLTINNSGATLAVGAFTLLVSNTTASALTNTAGTITIAGGTITTGTAGGISNAGTITESGTT